MAAIRSATQIAEKWGRVTPQRAAEYEEGVRNPLRDYAEGAIKANDAWKSGTQAAIQADRFVAGVRRTGTAKWQAKAATLGTQRFGPGVQLAQGDYERGFAPFAEAIQRVTLPPRGPRRSPQNLQRVKAIVDALSAAKEAQLRGGRA